jgi:glycosyltransferase involved in cell wall biosynthesis
MNSLLAMAKGIIVVGGGEEENYEIINEKELRPIINVRPSEEDIYQKLEYLVLNKEQIPELSAQSIEYVKRHHDHIKVARQYIDFWEMH